MTPSKRKTIFVRYGGVKKLAEDCKVSCETVRLALRWNADTDAQNLVRKRANELNLIRQW